MTCDVCKTNPATVFLTQIVAGKLQKVNLCESCSKENGVSDPFGFSLAEKLGGVGAAQEIERGSMQRCAVCGFTQADFKKTGRFGCAACYETFAETLQGLLKGMHKGLQHVGKVPTRMQLSIERDQQLKDLHTHLRKAVSEEDYESAAQLRDKIRSFE